MTYSTMNPAHLSSTHQSNLLTLLNRRLEVAKAHHNEQLVVALEREYEQMVAMAQPTTVTSRLENFWMRFAETLSEWNTVHIQQTSDASDRPSWYAYNPQAGQSLSTNSHDEMRRWLKQSYWEK